MRDLRSNRRRAPEEDEGGARVSPFLESPHYSLAEEVRKKRGEVVAVLWQRRRADRTMPSDRPCFAPRELKASSKRAQSELKRARRNPGDVKAGR
jgi:hypothetical protein